jgi:hypothetical protein
MKQEMYMFGIILMIMTLISAIGGAIRYEENFYNEIFDLLDEDGQVANSNQSDLANNAMLVPNNNDETLISEAPIVEEEMYSSGEVLMTSPSMEPAVMETVEGYTEPNVEPYEDKTYAAI